MQLWQLIVMSGRYTDSGSKSRQAPLFRFPSYPVNLIIGWEVTIEGDLAISNQFYTFLLRSLARGCLLL